MTVFFLFVSAALLTSSIAGICVIYVNSQHAPSHRLPLLPTSSY